MQFTHNAIITSDVGRIVEFYTRWCAMRLVKDREADGVRVAWLAPRNLDDLVFVVIQTSRPDRVLPDPSLGVHYGFQLDSRAEVDALHKLMHEAGVEVTAPSYEGQIVGYIFMAKDPDGRNVEFNAEQDVSPSSWDDHCDLA